MKDGVIKKDESTNQPREIIVYLCATDWSHEIGKGNSSGPHEVYNTVDEIREKRNCVNLRPTTNAKGEVTDTEFGCGIVRARLVYEEYIPAIKVD